MGKYVVFDRHTGLAKRFLTADDPPDHSDEEGILEVEIFLDFSAGNYVVRNGELVSIASPPSPDHEWDGTAWIRRELTFAEADARARAIRESLFEETRWYVERSIETGTPIPPAVSKFRQSLRDITLQPDYPFDIQWPSLDE